MDTSFHIKPFAFDRIFAIGGADSPAVRVEDLHLQIASLKAEMQRMSEGQEALLALARSEAFDMGLSQARSEREAAYLAATDSLMASLETVESQLDTTVTQIQQDAAELALAAAEMLAARAIENAPGSAIDLAIGRVLKQGPRGQELLIRVHPALVSEIERLVSERQAGDRRKLHLHVTGDDTMVEGDASIEWDQGGLVLDAKARADAIRSELTSLLPAG